MQWAATRILIIVSVAGILSSSGCTSAPKQMFLHTPDTGRDFSWPQNPEAGRIGYVGDLTGERNFSHAPDQDENAMLKALRWIAGLNGRRNGPRQLLRPSSGVVDSNGRVLVSDISRQAIFVFDPVNGSLDVWEDAGGLTPFRSPVAISRGPAGGFYVSDAEPGWIVYLDAKGNPRGKIQHPRLTRPTGLAWDQDQQRLYVADTRSHDIKVFSADGRLMQTIGEPGSAAGQMNAPTHVALRDDVLCVTETLNARVQCFNTDGTSRAIIGHRGLWLGNLYRPKGIAIDSQWNIYVVESFYDHLLIFDRNGRFLLPIGGTGSSPGKFYLPAGLWSDGVGRIYVADMFNGRVSVFRTLVEEPG